MELDGEKKVQNYIKKGYDLISSLILMICRLCSKPADKGCSSCSRVNYCCREHQKEDWRLRHRNECFVVLKESEEIGRFFVAQRDIKAGTIIFDERPIIMQPGMSKDCLHKIQDEKRITNRHVGLICLGCSMENCKGTCPKCGWPVCNEICSKIVHHADYECKLFQEKSIKFNGSFNCTISSALLIIRGVLMEHVDPEKYSEIQNLVSKVANKEYPPSHIQKDQFNEFKKIIWPYLKKMNLGENFVNLEKLRQISYLAGFRDLCYQPQTQNRITEVVYTKSSLLSHGCFSNCSVAIGPGPKFQKITWTNIDIEKGEMLTTLYNPAIAKRGAGEYTRFLVNRNMCDYKCHCSRCLDPTESGTMMSAIKCPCGGYYLPVDHHDTTMDAKWTCTLNCDQKETTFNPLNDLLKSKFGKMVEMNQKYLGDFKKVKEFIQELNETFHPNHWLIIAFTSYFVEFSQILMDSLDKWAFYIKQVDYLSSIDDLVHPGLHEAKSNHLKVKMGAYRNYRMWCEETGNCAEHEMIRIDLEIKKSVEVLLKLMKIHLQYKNSVGQQSIRDLELYLSQV